VKPPPDVSFRPELGLLLWKPRGLLDEKAVNEILAFIADQETRSVANDLRFVDTTELTAVDLNFDYVFHVALYRRLTRQGRPVIKSAFFVNDEALSHYFKLHALLTDHSPLKVRIFKEREAAAKWLNVSVGSLQPSPESP
jgi:hypothetical protein